MKSTNSILFLFLIFTLGFTSCSKDDDNGTNNSGNTYTGPGCATAWSSELQDEIEAFNQASQNLQIIKVRPIVML